MNLGCISFDVTQLLRQQLETNTNTLCLKEAVSGLCKTIEDRSYAYCTLNFLEYLHKLYNKSQNSEVIKKKLQQITVDKFEKVQQQILSGKYEQIKANSSNQREALKEQQIQKLKDFADQYFEIGSQSLQTNIRTMQANERIASIKRKAQQFRDRMESIKRKQQQKKQKRQKMQEQIEEKMRDNKKKHYQQEVRKNNQILKQREKERQQNKKIFAKFFYDFKRSKPLYQLIEQEQAEKAKIEQTKLEKPAKPLKPSLQQLNCHERAYLHKKSSYSWISSLKNTPINVSYYSRFYHYEKERQRQVKQESADMRRSKIIKENSEHRRTYSQRVREDFKPKTSMQMKQQLEKSYMRQPIQQSKDRTEIYKTGLKNLQYLHSLQKKRKASKSRENTKIQKPRYINYLTEFKEKQAGSIEPSWQRDLRNDNLSPAQKKDRIMIKSRQLERKAQLEQRCIANHNYSKREEVMAKKKQVDDTIIQSLQAKVALLKECQR